VLALKNKHNALERSKNWKVTHLQVFKVQKYLFAKDYGTNIIPLAA